MYRHLMVPVDDSALSAANVDAAVRLAQRLGARITFFHATADLGATGEGELLRAMDPEKFSEAALGDTHAVLAKASASAAALGVPCESWRRTSDRPAEAIVEAVKARQCDLVVMASRGTRSGIAGWLHTSQTERVLRECPVALLVTRVATNDPPTASERALAVILDEHRSIAAVVRGMQQLVAPSEQALDIASLDAFLHYLQSFPLQMHHPKEESFLHARLRERAPQCEPLLQELEAQHVLEHRRVADTLATLQAVHLGDAATRDRLVAQVDALASAVWAHLALEERSVLPLAREHLQPADWDDMARAFEDNDGPSFGELPAAEFRKLFTRIANLMPAANLSKR